MMKSVLIRSALLLAVGASLSACGETRRALGVDKAPPDEFQVIQRAPLATPPDYTLRPPAPGTVRPQEGTPREQAKAALAGPEKVQAIATQNRDFSDVNLLKKAGVDTAQKDIRDLVDKESLLQTQRGTSFTDKVMFWEKPKKPGEGERLDANAEAAQLQLKRGTTDGVNPRIEKPSSILSGVLPDTGSASVLPENTSRGLKGFVDWLTEQ